MPRDRRLPYMNLILLSMLQKYTFYDEPAPGGSDAYKKYVAEWLADEETVCVSLNDFRHLQELLLFSAIPHSETFTPDGLRVREDVKIQSLFNIDMELQALKERIK